MSQLSWNEIRDRALKFSKEWKDETNEEAEAKSFWDEFFNVFGVRRRIVASFEQKVKNIRGKYSFIDLFWSGKLLVEHKSRGKDLAQAESQAFQYIDDLIASGRGKEVPRYVLLSDFDRFALYDLEPEDGGPGDDRVKKIVFKLADLQKNVREFAFIKGEKPVSLNPEDPANIEAAEIMGKLHDALADGGYSGHDLERFLVRVLFCLFAEDTGIFEPGAFTNFVTNDTREDGSDLGGQLTRLFSVLDTPEDARQKNLDEDLAAFPYVNGDLFKAKLGFPEFNSSMRDALVECTSFRWEKISPAIFGSMFQGILDKKERRQLGAHYTSERDILKVVRSLFLEDLRARFARLKKTGELERFHQYLASLKFLDPACGCGNFLVITYRELRTLELELLQKLHDPKNQYLDVKGLVRLSVENFYGIEVEEWPARIAEVAMWLMDHQMNQVVAQMYGNAVPSIPLKKSPHIAPRNALRMKWEEFLPKKDCSYVLGNPPFVGKKEQNADQKSDMGIVWSKVKGAGVLDYVTAWYRKAAEYIQGTTIKCGFVSTNSITQGEQVCILFGDLFGRWKCKIHFGHRTFPWESEARGKAHVHVVIVGFGAFDPAGKTIIDYQNRGKAATATSATNISPYLIEGPDLAVCDRSNPLWPGAPKVAFGNMPNDGGNLLLTDIQKKDLVAAEPKAEQFIRRFVGPDEYLYNIPRWCLWLVDASPAALRGLPQTLTRIDAVRAKRLKSSRDETIELANTPSLFGEIRQPISRYLAIPKTSSEDRTYIPIGFLDPEVIVSTDIFTCPAAGSYEFGVLTSGMHMAWTRQVCGRLESRFRYSAGLVYNNFPWPTADAKQKAAISTAAEQVLAERAAHPDATLADLYDRRSMPAELVKAHARLDREVEKAYRPAKFESDRQRFEFLFAMYQQAIAPLLAEMEAKANRKKKKQDADPAKD